MIRKLQFSDLQYIFVWRNNISVRKNMFSSDLITWKQHINWFKKNINDSNKILLLYHENSLPIGYICLTRLFNGNVAEWGFYVNPDAPKGSGTKACEEVISYLGNYDIIKITAQVLSFNERSIALHNRLGFKLEGLLEQQYFDGIENHDILCFGKFIK